MQKLVHVVKEKIEHGKLYKISFTTFSNEQKIKGMKKNFQI